MNWYLKIKLAQMYEDVVPGYEYGKDDEDGYFKANQYFSIGQNDETTDKSYCWIWTDGKLFTKKGPTSHNMAFRGLTPNIENNYRGWYDPIQNLVSVVVPSGSGNFRYVPGAIYTEDDIPETILQALNRKFKNATLKVF